jgi:LPXTG-motif cell wall-anchored protein
MANPQQPELARSRKTPAQDQDSVAGVVEGQREVGASAPRGPVPPENQPGNHPEQEQDKPDLDAFAVKFGIAEDGAPEMTGRTPAVAERVQEAVSGVTKSKSPAFAVAAGVLSLLAALGLLLSRRRRRAREH